MAKADDIRAQLELTQQLNKALERQAELQAKLNTGASKQAQLMGDMANAASKGGNSGIQKRLADQRKLTSEIENTRKKSSDMTNELQRGMKKQAESMGAFGKAFGGIGKFMTSWKGMALGAIGGLVGGVAKMFSGLTGLVKGVFSIITNVVKTAMGVIKALIMAPFKLMDAFNGMANELLRIQSVINGARQGVRGMIGDHEKHGSIAKKAYEATGAAIKKFGKGLYDAHEQGSAQRIKDRGEMVKFMGVYKDQLKKGNEVAINMSFLMRKAMGMSTEDAESLTGMVKAYGEDINETFKQTVVGIGSLSDKMGLDIRVLTKNFMTFHNKLKPATGMSTQRLQVMSATFTKLGIDAGKALSMFDKFDTLEGGAEVVSKMSRSLGIHLSQTQMIMAREKGPLEQMKLVQQSMRMAGKSMEDLSYDGKKMLAEMFGGDEAAAMKAFGAAGIDSTESIEAAAEAAAKAKKAKDLPAIMKSVQRSIQGVANSFGKIMKPLEAFMKGFMLGMQDKGFVIGMKTVSKVFENMGKSFGKFFGKTNLMGKMATTLGNFAKKIEEVMPLIEELLANLFTDQPRSSRSAFEVIKEISSKLLGAYTGFYDDVMYYVLAAAQKVIPVMIKTAAWLAGTLNDVFTGALTGNYQALQARFSGMGSDTMFDSDRLNDQWKEMGSATSKAFNDSFMKKSKKYIAVNGRMQLRNVGLGEAFMANLEEAVKKGASKLGELIWKGVKYAFDNTPAWVIAAVSGAIALLLIPGGAAAVALVAGVSALVLKANEAIADMMDSEQINALAEENHKKMQARIKSRALELKLDVANEVAATKGLIAKLKGILEEEVVSNDKDSAQAIQDAAKILEKNAPEIARVQTRLTAARKVDAYAPGGLATLEEGFKAPNMNATGAFYDQDISTASFVDFTVANQDMGKKYKGASTVNLYDQLVLARQDQKGGRGAEIDKLVAMLKTAAQVRANRGEKHTNYFKKEQLMSILEGFSTSELKGGIHVETADEGRLVQMLLMAQKTLADKDVRFEQNLLNEHQAKQRKQLEKVFGKLNASSAIALKSTLEKTIADKGADSKEGRQAKNVLEALNNIMDPITGQKFGKHTIKEHIRFALMRAEENRLKALPDSDPVMKRARALAVSKGKTLDQVLATLAWESSGGYMTGTRTKATQMDAGQQAKMAAATDAFIRGRLSFEESGLDKATYDVIQKIYKEKGISKTDDYAWSATTQSGVEAVMSYLAGDHLKRDGKPSGPAKPGTPSAGKKITPGKAATKTVMKKGVVGVKPPSKAKKLGALPASVLMMLGNKRKVKQMFDAGLEITSILEKMQPAADAVSKALNSNAVPAMNATADASQQATEKIAGTVVMLGLVRDKLNEIQTAYQGIMKTVVDIKKEGDKLKGQHSADIKTATGTLKVEIKVEVNSNSIASALEKTPVVTWSGALGPQEEK